MTDAKFLRVRTAKFGEIEVPEEKIIRFSEGIPGFAGIRKFAILEFEDLRPFLYLQSLDDPPIALLVVNPFLLHPAYEFQVGDADMHDLQTDKPEEVAVYAVATIPENHAEATINLMAPILIHEKKRCGKQVILLEGRYPVRHPIFGPSAQDRAGSE
jgi:flagellar assembly factor FliW